MLDDLSSAPTKRLAPPRSRRLPSRGRLRVSPAVVSGFVHKCDVVFHLAAVVGVQLIVEQPGYTLLTTFGGRKRPRLLLAFGKRVLVASSSEVYGDHPEEQLLREDAQRIYGPTTARRWAYADSKAMDEFFALARHEEDGLDCVIARLFNTVGPRQSGRYGMVIPRFVQAALSGRPLEVYGDGTQTRCFCHVADSARALQRLMDEHAATGQIFNVGSQERIAIKDLAERIRELNEQFLRDRVRSLCRRFPHGAAEDVSTACLRSRRSRRQSAGVRRSISSASWRT